MSYKYNLRLLPGRQCKKLVKNVSAMENLQNPQPEIPLIAQPPQQDGPLVLPPNPPQDLHQDIQLPQPNQPVQDLDHIVPEIPVMEPAPVQPPLHNPLAGTFKPVSFNGLHPETAERWWHAFDRYATLSGIQGNDRSPLLGLLLSGSAEIWYNSLPPQIRDDYAALEAAFREKYITAAHTQLQRQMSLLTLTQRVGETVDEYVTEARSKMVDYNYDEDLQMTLIINGLRPEIKTVVMQHLPFQDIDALVNKARHVESALKIQIPLFLPKYSANTVKMATDSFEDDSPSHLKVLEGNIETLTKKFDSLVQEFNQALKSEIHSSPTARWCPIDNKHSWTSQPNYQSRQPNYRRNQVYNDYQSSRPVVRERDSSKRSSGCWTCGQHRHFQSQCPQNIPKEAVEINI